VHFFDAHGLSRKDLAEVDFFLAHEMRRIQWNPSNRRISPIVQYLGKKPQPSAPASNEVATKPLEQPNPLVRPVLDSPNPNSHGKKVAV
jgi:hypothetical protein